MLYENFIIGQPATVREVAHEVLQTNAFNMAPEVLLPSMLSSEDKGDREKAVSIILKARQGYIL